MHASIDQTTQMGTIVFFRYGFSSAEQNYLPRDVPDIAEVKRLTIPGGIGTPQDRSSPAENTCNHCGIV